MVILQILETGKAVETMFSTTPETAYGALVGFMFICLLGLVITGKFVFTKLDEKDKKRRDERIEREKQINAERLEREKAASIERAEQKQKNEELQEKLVSTLSEALSNNTKAFIALTVETKEMRKTQIVLVDAVKDIETK